MTLEQAKAWTMFDHGDQLGLATAYLNHAIRYLDIYSNYNVNTAAFYSDSELTAWLHHLTGHTACTIRASRRSSPRGD